MSLPLYSEILPDLYMGGTSPDGDEGDIEFDAVVSLESHSHAWSKPTDEFRFAFQDGTLDEDLEAGIEQVADWAFLKWHLGGKVLIRCAYGINRSGLVTALVLMREKMSAQDAIDLIREKRHPRCLENQNFVDYLKRKL
jgi:protein-tyrosine phosphatase